MKEINDWLMFNNIVYKIHTTRDNNKMRSDFLEELHMLIEFDAADFYLARPDGGVGLCSPVKYNCSGVCAGKFDELDYSRGILYSGNCMAYRETDIISDEIRVGTEYYNKLYRPNGWHYSAQIILAHEKKFVGVVSLYRKKERENFTHEEIMVLDMLKDHLAFRLYNENENAPQVNTDNAVTSFSDVYSLTRREETVLKLILEGKSNKEISDELVISVHTLKKHIMNIYRKAEVNSRGQLMNKAVKRSI